MGISSRIESGSYPQAERTKYIEVVFNLPIDKGFHYAVPDHLSEAIRPGQLVRAPFRKRWATGICTRLIAKPEVPNTKQIDTILYPEPLIDEPLLKLTKAVADHYLCAWGEVIFAAIPPPIRSPRYKRKIKDGIMETPYLAPAAPVQLTSAQQGAMQAIKEALSSKDFKVILLHGVTGSGKTEIYIRALKAVVAQGQQGIVLVPEIALTPQTVLRFSSLFSRVVVLHSMLTDVERARRWTQIRRGEVDVVIGTRSAIFSPLPRVGLIVLDEEHETTYKQETTPRYHAREVALQRARLSRALLILGSATPSLESYHHASSGSYLYVPLPERIHKRPLAKVEIVNMATEMREVKRYPILSRRLVQLIKETLIRGEQVLLFLNRRGFSTWISCPRCGWLLRCKRCDIALVYHKKESMVLCHYCLRHQDLPKDCPDCKGQLRWWGIGTERIQEEINQLLPDFHISRMDSDTMKHRDDYRAILEDLWKGQIDLLVGTQMLAKGLDVPNVTLVGVISADIPFHIPDFRSSERAFQLITQVAGRAGRGPKGGRVVIQTFNPEHYSIKFASGQDYIGFAQKELGMRRELSYPPFANLIRWVFQGRNEASVRRSALRWAEILRERFPGEDLILGPAPAPLYRLKGRYRVQVLMKAPKFEDIKEVLKALQNRIQSTRTIQCITDIDPVSMY
jgi:primosomal protein N' (replication factor Y)